MNTVTTAAADIRPVDLLTTSELTHRPTRAPNFRAAAAAFCELSELLADDPDRAIRRFPEIARELCKAGTAGVSLLRLNETGEPIVQWTAISGALTPHEGAVTPRNFSPCGICLDTGTTVLLSQPERVFTYLRETGPPMVEDLIVPLCDRAGKSLGTFWAAHHDRAAHFCSGDALIMEQLAAQLVLALQLVEEKKQHRSTLALLGSQQERQLAATHDLAEERVQRELAEVSASGAQQTLLYKDSLMDEVNHRAKNTLQIAANLLMLQARASPAASDIRTALQDGYRRLHLLAKVHELLYKSADSMRRISMPTLLHAMSDALQQSFAGLQVPISLQVIADQVHLPPDDAIPMALLANEAITNAYKHAFTQGVSGTIIVTLRYAPEDSIVLQISDNGVGMNSEGNETSLGLRLIVSFAAQLRGTLTFDKPVDGTGTAVTLTIRRTAAERLPQCLIAEGTHDR